MTFDAAARDAASSFQALEEGDGFSFGPLNGDAYTEATMTVVPLADTAEPGPGYDPDGGFEADFQFSEEPGDGDESLDEAVSRLSPVIRGTGRLLRGAGEFTSRTVQIPVSFLPLLQLLGRNEPTDEEELSEVLDTLFQSLYEHPVTTHTRRLSDVLRRYKLIPNEQTTERLIHFVVNQAIMRSPVPVPEAIVSEFWGFFHELFSAPELKGLLELNLDIVRLVLRTYQPLLVDLINLLKDTRRVNQAMVNELVKRVRVIRGDLRIIRRQLRAIRYIKPFFQTDPEDFRAQAQIVAQMVREFGPFFIKMAQVAAANSDFLPDEISRELAVFQEDVPPMTPAEVRAAFIECYGKQPEEMFYDLDLDSPVRSGSIGSVYLAKKKDQAFGMEILRPVILKVGRHNLEREFLMGKTAIGLALLSSQYWAPHSKLAPFLEALLEQVDEFVRGFERELNFEIEAHVQRKFYRRARKTGVWRIPRVYSANHRILEMEYLDDAVSVNRAIEKLPHHRKEKFQRRMADRFLYTVLTHIFVYREFHGDLHPGNIMVNPDGDLFLIDWGNSVKLEGRWQKLWNYVSGVVFADVERLAEALIEISNNPTANRRRRAEIIATLRTTLEKKNITPLKRDSVRQLRREGLDGLHRRFQAAMQLMSNTQQLGVVIDSGYLHMSRSFFALSGSYATMYDGLPKSLMAIDVMRTFAHFPVDLAKDRVLSTGHRARHGLVRRLPFTVLRKTPRKKEFDFKEESGPATGPA